MYRELPSSQFFEEMDPIEYLWLYESWCRDLEEQNEFAKSYAILTGSASNPEWARRIIKSENPDFESSDEAYEETSRKMLETNRKPESKHRRIRKLVK